MGVLSDLGDELGDDAEEGLDVGVEVAAGQEVVFEGREDLRLQLQDFYGRWGGYIWRCRSGRRVCGLGLG